MPRAAFALFLARLRRLAQSVLTGTMVLHVQKLDGVLDLFGVSVWYLMVTFVYLFFWWPVSSIVTALARR